MAHLDSESNRRAFVTGAIFAGTAVGHPAQQGGKNSQGSLGVPGRLVTLQARPGPIDINTGKTAVVVIDMQNDFGAKGGMFDRAGLDISGIQKVIPPTASVLRAARNAASRSYT